MFFLWTMGIFLILKIHYAVQHWIKTSVGSQCVYCLAYVGSVWYLQVWVWSTCSEWSPHWEFLSLSTCILAPPNCTTCITLLNYYSVHLMCCYSVRLIAKLLQHSRAAFPFTIKQKVSRPNSLRKLSVVKIDSRRLASFSILIIFHICSAADFSFYANQI